MKQKLSLAYLKVLLKYIYNEEYQFIYSFSIFHLVFEIFRLRPRPHVCVFKSTPSSKVSVFARPHDNAAFSKISVFESLHFQTHFRKSPFSVKTETFENAEQAFACGRKAKTNRKVSVFAWKRIRVDVALHVCDIQMRCATVWRHMVCTAFNIIGKSCISLRLLNEITETLNVDTDH